VNVLSRFVNSWWATNGSPATSTSDFSTVGVNGRNRVANPLASRASAGT